MKLKKSLILIVFFLIPFNVSAFDHTHKAFNTLLERHVKMISKGLESRIDYAAFKKDHLALADYLASLSGVTEESFYTWPKEQQLAFLINLYNAATIDLILKHYPVSSIKKIGSLFQSPWKIRFITLFGKTISLDDLEHGLIRKKGVYDEPRIHFALVCASIGCPGLPDQVFRHDRLETMLEKGLVTFLSDKTRNRYNHGKKRFEVSAIFKWYGNDFNESYGSVTTLLRRYSQYLVGDEKELPDAKKTERISYLDYNWELNEINESYK